MDTTRWKAGDEFGVLDLVAQLRFKSPSSMSFHLGKNVDRDSPQLPEMGDELMKLLSIANGAVFLVVGWLDVHHPCEGIHRLQLRAGLPERYVGWETMRDLTAQVIAALSLPGDEPYHVEMGTMSHQTFTEVPWSQL